MTLLYVCAMLIFFEVALVYDASFVRYSVLSSDVMVVMKLCLNWFDKKSHSRLQFLLARINMILRLIMCKHSDLFELQCY